MTSIQRFVQITAAFDPEATRTLGQAFDMACAPTWSHAPADSGARGHRQMHHRSREGR